jgi:hypothetical protein
MDELVIEGIFLGIVEVAFICFMTFRIFQEVKDAKSN